MSRLSSLLSTKVIEESKLRTAVLCPFAEKNFEVDHTSDRNGPIIAKENVLS